jgi:CPA2 family monovalent cation:H+ antiporter-2
MTEAARDAIVGAAILSITANPFLFRTIPVLNRLLRRQPERAAEASEPPPDRAEGASRAVVVGYGPVGRTVTRLLGESEIRCTIVEMNIDTVRALSGTGIDVVHGDATHEDILQAARLADAQSLIISTAGLPGVEEMLRAARRINPRVQILARATSAKRPRFAPREPTRSSPAKAKWPWPSQPRYSVGLAPPPSKSTASARACTPS